MVCMTGSPNCIAAAAAAFQSPVSVGIFAKNVMLSLAGCCVGYRSRQLHSCKLQLAADEPLGNTIAGSIFGCGQELSFGCGKEADAQQIVVPTSNRTHNVANEV